MAKSGSAPKFKFVELYDNDMKVFGRVRRGNVPHINAGVMSAMENAYNYDLTSRLTVETAEDLRAAESDEDMIRRMGFNPEDRERLPGYVERSLEARHPDERAVEQRVRDAYESVYDAAYHVRDVLSERTRAALGDDYARYEIEREADERKKARADFERMRLGGRPDCVRITSTGGHLELTDENGHEDPFAFDEFDTDDEDTF